MGAFIGFSKCILVLQEAGCPGQGLGPVRQCRENSDLVLGAGLTPGWDLGGGVGSYVETARNIPPPTGPSPSPRGGPHGAGVLGEGERTCGTIHLSHADSPGGRWNSCQGFCDNETRKGIASNHCSDLEYRGTFMVLGTVLAAYAPPALGSGSVVAHITGHR